MPTQPLRILIAAGGTGGHVLPAVAVLEEIRRRNIDVELLWIGGHEGVEKDLARANGIEFIPVHTGKLRRYLSVKTFTDLPRIPLGIAQAWRHVRKFRPDVIFSTGGAVSVPTVAAGRGVCPILTHEQTAQVGVANRTVARFATRFAVAYEETAQVARQLHDHVVITGNPVRASLALGDRQRGRDHFGFTADLPILFVTGGARGASPLNTRIEALLPNMLEHIQIVHQTGPSVANPDAARLGTKRESWPDGLRNRYAIREFIGSELADLYAAADIVLARSGAGTVAELAYLGKAGVLIPLPGTWGDEQRKNAAVLTNNDAAITIEQNDATPEKLESVLMSLFKDPLRRNAIAANAKRIGKPDAASRLVDELLGLVEYETSANAQIDRA